MPTVNPYRPLIVAAVLLVLIGILGYASTVLIPIALGVLLSFVLMPAVAWMQARGLRRNYAVILVITLTLLLIVGMLAALTMQLRELAGDVDKNRVQIKERIEQLMSHKGGESSVSRLWKFFEEIGEDVRGEEDKAEHRVQDVRIVPSKSSTLTMLLPVAAPIWAVVGKIGLTLGLTTSMLVMREDLRNRIFLLLGEGNLTSSTKAMDDASRRISRYLITQLVLNASYGAVFGLGLSLLGVRYALVWAVLAAVLRFIPYVGTWMGTVFPIIVSLIHPGWTPVLTIGWCVLLGMVANSVIEPRLTSRSTGVTPIALVVSAAFWTWLWGPIGLVLATPLAVCLSVLGKHVESLRFLDVLLGGQAPLEPEVLFYQRLLARDEAEASDLIEEYLKAHTSEELVDGLLVPTLMRARADFERHNLSDVEISQMVGSMRNLITEELGEPEAPSPSAALVLGCPSYDALDQLVLELFGRSLDPAKARLQILSPDLTAAEVVEKAAELRPAVVCVGLVPPGGGSRARYLCKRLRAKLPKLPIVAAVWGSGDPGELGARLLAAGAVEVAGSVSAARAAVVPLVSVASQLNAATATLEPVG